ncbi:unnamed protein product [Parnassius apollo]|uniref:(apollo) hypothetical protein n=1 Tax=Parnassius apollo TaxID=110799 RepID=A0A8S3YCK9_PARAO|nr:unnamed protein product [Parnassius apollo]
MSVATSKAAYKRHAYSGSRKNLKRVRGGLRRYHGEASRLKAWRSGEMKMKSVNEEIVADNPIIKRIKLANSSEEGEASEVICPKLENVSVAETSKSNIPLNIGPFENVPRLENVSEAETSKSNIILNIGPPENVPMTNEASNMSALDKFKRRLVRDIARRIYQEKQCEEEMWLQLKNEYGCDCHLLWEHMRALTLKKLKRLLAAEDRIGYITRIARMTLTDWLTFDLVLVHEKVDVIGEDMTLGGKPEPEIFIILLNLVEKYGIETLAPKFLVDAWFNLTIEYNTGGRQCSPMLLQRRWYQLKESTRSKFYNFWQTYRGNPKLLPKANENKPTKVQMLIAERFQHVVTQPFQQWENLIQMKRVVQAGAFESRRRIKESEISNSENDPDLIVVEPTVETIEVAADSDDEDTAGMTDNSSTNNDIPKDNPLLYEEDLGVTIKTEPTDDVTEVDEQYAVNELENIQIPVETGNHVSEDAKIVQDSCETVTDAAFKEPPELTLPKITSVMGNVDIPLEFHLEINETTDYAKSQENVDKTVADDEKDLEIDKNNLPSGNTIEEKNNKVSENECEDTQMSFKTDVVSTNDFLKDNVTDLDNSKKMSEEQSEDIIASSFLKKEVVPNFDELPIDLEFVDDGIELLDNDVECVGEDRPVNIEKGGDIRTEIKQEAIDESVGENDATFKIDQKLIMFPITFTKKLDDMIILKNTSYFQVKGDDIIQSILNESKPTIKVPVKEEQISEDESDSDSETNDVVHRVKYTSWLLKKPKFRSYNPIQLCKNPDFNTRLKRLTVGFFSIERNRQLFSACKPVTIDLHKAFETKLDNNTLHLEASDTPVIKQEKSDVCENTASVIPSAIAVQSLLDNSKVSVEELLPTKEEIDVSNTPVNNYCVIERSRSINLPDIEEIRRVNQKLLTAEVSPIPLKNNLAYNKPPVQLIKPTDEDKINSHSHSTPKANHENPSNVQEEKKKKIMKRTVPIPKIRPSRTIPSWSVRVPQERIDDDTLLTEDTLNKVLCLLNGNDEPLSKSKHKKDDTPLKEHEANQVKSNELIEENKQTVSNEKSVNIPGDLIDEMELRQSVAFLQQSNGSKKKRSKKNIAKPNRTIATQSGYCCWAQYKIQNFTQYGRRLRHLCPKPLCNCCCRNLLLNKMLYPENKSDSNAKDSRTGKQGQLSAISSRKKFDINKYISSYEDNTNIYSEVHTAPTTQVATIDSITPGASSDSSIQFPLPSLPSITLDDLQSEKETNEALSALVSLKESTFSEDCNSFQKDNIPEKPVRIQENVIQESECTEDVNKETNPKNEILSKAPKRLMKTRIVSAVNYSPQYEKAAVEKQSKKQNLLPNSAIINFEQRIRIEECSHIETITLDDDENTDVAVMATNMDSNNMLLPKGVNLLLLPDNTLSVSIDAGMQIDQDCLANLPEILTAVQKHLAETGVMQVLPQDAVLNVDDSCEIDDTRTRLATSETQIRVVEDNSENISNLNNEHSYSVPENSNSETNNLKTPDDVELNSQSVLNIQSNITNQTTDNNTETKDETADTKQENTCGISIPDTNRKTILSDLMTLSGISPEDAFTPIEESPQYSVPKLLPSSIPSSSKTVIDNINKDDQSKLKKPIKRIKISIRKIGRKNLPKDTESVIDLTDECDNSVELTETSENHSEGQSIQPLIKKYVVDVKHQNNVSNDAQPLKLFKSVRPRILKKGFPQMLQLSNLDKKVKNALAKFYLPLREKPQYIKILPKSAVVKHSTKALSKENLKNLDKDRNSGDSKDKHKKICELDSDSSDDEPLAKKVKRIKALPTNNSDESTVEINNITPVESYNVPLEFMDVPPQITDKTVTESDSEENCILGV